MKLKCLQLVAACLFALSCLLASSAFAETYSIHMAYLGYNGNSNSYMANFTLDDNTLSTTSYRSYYDEIKQTYVSNEEYDLFTNGTLKTSGTWATCGTITDSGDLIADPYATFVITKAGAGNISWSANTPRNYVAPLMIGAIFNGCGYTTVETEYMGGIDFNATLYSHYPVGDHYEWYYTGEAIQHTFYATYVPEPSSIIAVLSGLATFAWGIKRR